MSISWSLQLPTSLVASALRFLSCIEETKICQAPGNGSFLENVIVWQVYVRNRLVHFQCFGKGLWTKTMANHAKAENFATICYNIQPLPTTTQMNATHVIPLYFTISNPAATDPHAKHQASAPSLPIKLCRKSIFVTVLLTFNALARACGQKRWQTMWNLRTCNAICYNIQPCPLPHNERDTTSFHCISPFQTLEPQTPVPSTRPLLLHYQ